MNEAELVFTQVMNCNRLSLYLNKSRVLDKNESFLVSSVLKRRVLGEPLPYILGKTEFMGLELKVCPDVFIPRPETEILVEAALKIGHSFAVTGNRLKVLDMCTGCGNIAISVAKVLPHCEIDAVDISGPALEAAVLNAELNNVKVNFIQGNLFDTHNLKPGTYDLIISNPPYIPAKDIDGLPVEVQYEPRAALDGGEDGLDFYRRIISAAPAYLRQDGFLIMEMGFNQKEAIENIVRDSGNFKITDAVKDYNNIDRVAVARKGYVG